MAETSSTLTPSSMARKARKRAVSSTPAWPMTRCGRKTGHLPRPLHHGVQRIADHDHDRLGAGVFDLLGHGADDAGVGGQQVVAAHARLARHARR